MSIAISYTENRQISRVLKVRREKEMAFFEKVGETLAARSRDVADKAREMAEVNRLNGQLHTQRSTEEKIYMEIGRMIYENREDWQSVDIADQLERLDSVQEEIAHLQKEILRVKGLRRCGNCGAEIDRNVSFCPKCGLAMEALREEEEAPGEGAQEDVEETEAGRCPGCNQEIEPGAVFCPFCGMKLK